MSYWEEPNLDFHHVMIQVLVRLSAILVHDPKPARFSCDQATHGAKTRAKYDLRAVVIKALVMMGSHLLNP